MVSQESSSLPTLEFQNPNHSVVLIAFLSASLCLDDEEEPTTETEEAYSETNASAAANAARKLKRLHFVLKH